MFISDTHLPLALPPQAYYSTSQFEQEWQNLFLTGWHFLATTSDLPNPGDYVTLRVGLFSVIIRNFGQGDYQAFLNVCAHRYSELASEKCGNTPTFSCQYHGWEFDREGNTKRIPDAPCFKPLEKGQLGLKHFRTATVGQLIFVSFAENGPTIQEFLGSCYADMERCDTDHFEQVYALDQVCDANWKLIVENTLESYHIDMIHRQTIQQMPNAENCSHELHDQYSIFRTTPIPRGSFRYWVEETLAKSIEQPAKHNYVNLRFFPGLTISYEDMIIILQSNLPLDATHSVCIYRFLTPKAKNWRVRLINQFYRPSMVKFWMRVIHEDLGFLPKMQKGIQSQELPKGGLLSAREERVYHFQKYVQEACKESIIK